MANYHKTGFLAPEEESKLLMAVMQRIEREKALKKIRIRIALLLGWLLVSLGFFAAAFGAFYSRAAESGFITFLKLGFSDFAMVAGAWESYAYALLEALPSAGIALVVSSVLLILFSLKSLARGLESLGQAEIKNNLNTYGL